MTSRKQPRGADGRFKPKEAATRRNPEGAGYLAGGVFHPIRSWKGYEGYKYGDLSGPVGRGIKAWLDGNLYLGNDGNYRLKTGGKRSGAIAPFNKPLKKAFPDNTDLHLAAVEASRTYHGGKDYGWVGTGRKGQRKT
jgi:hypothetical protein